MIIILRTLEKLSRAELSAVYFHLENLLFRGFEIVSVIVSQNEKFYVCTIKSYNNKRELDRVRNYSFYTEQELNYFLEMLTEHYIFTVERKV